MVGLPHESAASIGTYDAGAILRQSILIAWIAPDKVSSASDGSKFARHASATLGGMGAQ